MSAVCELKVASKAGSAGRRVSGMDFGAAKFGFATRSVPMEKMARVSPMGDAPRAGDLVAAEVQSVGKNVRLETRAGVQLDLFPGDVIVGAFGNRYATGQFEGYVPDGPVEECDQMSVGGVCGVVSTRNEVIGSPTRLRVLGQVHDESGEPLNTEDFGLKRRASGARPRLGTIVVLGSSMDSGKTNTAGTIARSLSRRGFRVAAAKTTGTAAGKDGRFFEASGASPVLDFTSAGYPSTYMLDADELAGIYHTLLAHLCDSEPDYVVIEVADGILQRETKMMLESGVFQGSADHVFFSAGDSLAVESGARRVREYGLPLRATAGLVTRGPLAAREAEEFVGLPCMSIERLMSEELTRLIGAPAKITPNSGATLVVPRDGAALG